MSNMSLSARSVAGIAILSAMIAVAAWIVMRHAHQNEASQKVGVVIVEDL